VRKISVPLIFWFHYSPVWCTIRRRIIFADAQKTDDAGIRPDAEKPGAAIRE